MLSSRRKREAQCCIISRVAIIPCHGGTLIQVLVSRQRTVRTGRQLYSARKRAASRDTGSRCGRGNGEGQGRLAPPPSPCSITRSACMSRARLFIIKHRSTSNQAPQHKHRPCAHTVYMQLACSPDQPPVRPNTSTAGPCPIYRALPHPALPSARAAHETRCRTTTAGASAPASQGLNHPALAAEQCGNLATATASHPPPPTPHKHRPPQQKPTACAAAAAAGPQGPLAGAAHGADPKALWCS